MQTFLPFTSYYLSARHLDRKRLGKQRVECIQIAKAIVDPSYGWRNHLATRMWMDDPRALYLYTRFVVEAWIGRGYRDGGTIGKMEDILGDLIYHGDVYPAWLLDSAYTVPRVYWQGAKGPLNDSPICASHRAALLFKDPDHYGQFGWPERPAINYVWPTEPETYHHVERNDSYPAAICGQERQPGLGIQGFRWDHDNPWLHN
jgi:hypothetical protein